MKHPEKKDRRVTFFKGMMVVFLNLCLWVTPDEIVCSSPKEPLTKPIAEIISVDTGAVKINRNGETLPTEKNMELYEGDIITINRSCISLPCLSEDSKDRSKIDQSSLVTLRCLSGNLKDSPKTDPPCITLLCSPEDWKDSSEDVSSFSIKKLCSFNEQKSATQEQGKSTGLSHFLAIVSDFLFPEPVLTAPGAARKWDYLQAAIVDLVAPAATNVLTRQPHFQWLPLPGATQYELTLFDGLNTILWSQTTTETELVYPPEAPALVPGDYYFWQVKGVTTSDGEENSRRGLTRGLRGDRPVLSR